MSGTNDKMTVWALILSCTVIVAVGWLAVRTIQSLRIATDRVTHTQEVLVRLEGLKFDLKEAESAGRGYLLTPRAEFAAAVDASGLAVKHRLGGLAALVSDNPRQVDQLESLRPLVDRRLALVFDAVRLRESGALQDEQIDAILGEGFRAMTQVMLGVETLAQNEKLLLQIRLGRVSGRLNWVYAAIGGGFLLSLVLAGWPILRLRAELVEREKARRQLVASSERIHDLYNRAPCGYFSIDSKGRVTAMNDTLLQWLGLERATMSRLTIDDLCSLEERAHIPAWLSGKDSAHGLREREFDFLCADGRRLPVWLSAVRGGQDGSEWRITAVDVTERRRAETAAARAREQAESIVNTVRQPLLVLTEDMRVASANRAFHALLKTDDASVVGKKFSAISDGQWAAAELVRALEDVVTKQAALENFELSLNLPKKGRRLFELNASKLFRPGNEEGLTLVAIEDVTARRKLDDVHRQFRALFESLPGRYLVLNPDFTIVAVSDAYLAITEKRRGDIVGHDIFEVFPDNPHDPEASGTTNLRASFNRVLQNGVADTMPVQRYDLAGPDGSFQERHWSPVNSPVFGADKKIEYIIHRVEDVTEFVLGKKMLARGGADSGETQLREKIETEMLAHSRELGAANQQLRALNEELEAFSYSVSHDLRAPLRHIAGFAEMLSSHAAETLDDKGRRYLKTINDSAARMGTLIDDLLLFSRMGRSEIRRQKVPLGEIVADVREGLKHEENGRVVHWDVSPLPEVECDVPMLRQVFANLLGNAVKYTRKQPEARISITARLEGTKQVEITIRDNGAGFDMKYAPKLFGVFQRLHSASEFEGTGVGLAIVRRIIQRHGGRIWAESAPGAGATFYFTLPAARVNGEPT
jgi:PAS domain S-box-containing protein